MFGKKYHLFRILGFDIRIDLSWFLIAALLTWSIAEGIFRAPLYRGPELATGTRWLLGALGTLGLFASVVLHELAHAVVARRHGVEMRGITLFIFGGVAEMTDEPPTARAEFWIAAAGPALSLVLGGLLYALSLAPWPPAGTTLVGYLGLLNLVLVAFNLVPAFPLDGGRVLRAILWWRWGDLMRATTVAARIGSAFGILLMAFGGLSLLTGNLIGGLWWLVIGLFVRGAALGSVETLRIRYALKSWRVGDLMSAPPETVPPELTLRQLVDDYMLPSRHSFFPVVDAGGRLLGSISPTELKVVPRHKWETARVGQYRRALSADGMIAPDLDAEAALLEMSERGQSRIMVVEADRLVGVLALSDMVRLLKLHTELDAVAA